MGEQRHENTETHSPNVRQLRVAREYTWRQVGEGVRESWQIELTESSYCDSAKCQRYDHDDPTKDYHVRSTHLLAEVYRFSDLQLVLGALQEQERRKGPRYVRG